AKASDIRSRDHRVASDLVFEDHVILMDLRRLKVLRKELNRSAHRSLRSRGQNVGEDRCIRTARRKAYRCLAVRIARVDQRVIDRRALYTAIVDAISAAHARASVAE